VNVGRAGTRRDFVCWAAASTVAASRLAFAAEPPPETKRIRLARFPFDLACLAPMWIAEELLRAEGFEQVEYLMPAGNGQYPPVAAGELDLGITDIFSFLPQLDAGKATVALAGIHAGCYELRAVGGLRAVRELKGRTVVVANFGRKAFVSAVLAHVGLDPRRDVTFLERPGREGIELLEQNKVDALLGFPPEPQELRARGIGVTLLDTARDKPWSQYFCCIAIGNPAFVARRPVATRRALRALLKATDICAADPEQSAHTLVARGFANNAELAMQALREIPYRRWRELDSADSLRFYALRLHEVGAIKTHPQKLLAQATDWRFVEQLRKELKA
jgi:NitT/TauT family transport system substrate-binding protein